MKTSNFPEKKNQRRKNALARLISGKPRKNEETAQEEIATLQSRIADNVRNVRTKKVGGKTQRTTR